jgi:hypothetical protein
MIRAIQLREVGQMTRRFDSFIDALLGYYARR